MENDPITGEPVLLDLRTSMSWNRGQSAPPGAWHRWRAWAPLVPGWAFRPGVPQRAFAVSLLSGGALAWYLLDVEDPRQLAWLSFAWLATTVTLVVLEGTHARAYVTPTQLVRCYGILGLGRRDTLLSSIRRIEVDYSGLWPAGEEWDLGDLVVVCDHDRFVIAAVPDASEAARAVIAARDGQAEG